MKGKVNLHYYDEGDFLEILTENFTEGFFENLGKGVFQRVDEKTNTVTGIVIMRFRKRAQGLKGINVTLPIDIKLKSHKPSENPKN